MKRLLSIWIGRLISIISCRIVSFIIAIGHGIGTGVGRGIRFMLTVIRLFRFSFAFHFCANKRMVKMGGEKSEMATR